VEQKGIDLLIAALPELLKRNMQMIVLGNGDPEFEKGLQDVAKRHKDRMCVHIGYSEELAHRIEAGSDMFLMPSRFEPCGLNQLYSLRYGTIPIVRATGGLDDTIEDYSPSTGGGTGFKFKKYDSREMLHAVHRAVQTYADQTVWRKLMKTGMNKDFSWEASAKKYIQLYRGLVKK
jgi:starch synthase